jgi:hypothetical protein
VVSKRQHIYRAVGKQFNKDAIYRKNKHVPIPIFDLIVIVVASICWHELFSSEVLRDEMPQVKLIFPILFG